MSDFHGLLKNRVKYDNLSYMFGTVPCDVENDCNPNASCEFIETALRHKCVCQEGFVGDGYECVELVVSSCTIVSSHYLKYIKYHITQSNPTNYR